MNNLIKTVTFCIITLITTAISAGEYDAFTDERDGNVYKVVKIGRETWLAENMRYTNNDIDYKESQKPHEYGYLYSFAAAQKVCPAGFRLPTKVEFDRLLTTAYTRGTESENLRHKTWAKGRNLSGFGALPAGKCEKSGCSFLDAEAYFWSGTARNKITAYGLYVDINKALVSYGNSASYLSVRCIEESAEKQPTDSQIFTDPRDGKEYKTVKINNKIWFAENLRYAGVKHRWPNGDKNIDAAYGYLYKWEDAMTACPPGFHLPTREEFNDLLKYAGDGHKSGFNEKASDNLRSSSFLNGKDTYGFGALPAGKKWGRRSRYDGFGFNALFWSSMSYSAAANTAFSFTIRVYRDDKNIFKYHREAYTHDDAKKKYWLSVRCIKD